MADLSLTTTLPCSPSVVRETLHRQDFLAAFVDMQHPSEYSIVANDPLHQSRVDWTVSLPTDVPSLVRKLVGTRMTLELRIDTSPEGRLRLDAAGRTTGRLEADLAIDEHEGLTIVRIDGEIEVSAGLLSGQAAKMARDQVIAPVFVEDLFPLLTDWCVRGSQHA